MKTPLILSLLILISCTNKEQALIPNKKPFYESEQTVEPEARIAEEFEYKSFLTIPHTEGKSSLRNQLINNLIEFSLQKKALVIKDRLELDSTPMSANELGRYSENEMNLAKIIVTMTNGSEVFFVPENISLKNIASRIGLVEETDRKLKWLGVDESQLTENGKSYYLLSVNHDDLINNDRVFYTHDINLSNKFAGQSLTFARGTRLEVSIDHKFFKETVTEHEVVKNADCRYLKAFPSGQYAQIENQTISQLGFLMSKNKNWFSVTDSNIEITSGQNFKIHVHPEMMEDKEYTIEFSQNVTASIEESFPMKVPNSVCGFGFKKVSIETLKTKAEFNISVKVFGRGEKLREITL